KFIRVKKKLIALLKEQKQNIINQAVCKGINPHVRMKDSGVEWLGEIPEHWEVRKLKYIARIKNGKDYREVESSTGYPVIGSGGQFAYASNYLYDGKSVLFGRKGTIDKPLYRDGKFWAVDTMFYTEIYDIVISKFFYYVALTLPFDYYTTKTALPSITQKDLNNHSIVLPPKIEQQAIVDFIEKETSLIDKTISKAEREIELIQEYRTRLVSDVVTGKIYPQITQINADFDVG
ncbi:MAG: restriction endonuclease subunit S, partial [Desulfococcaceae bacterium]|nr:restriction endonuclease subunit S [Desulfococcaceae bacterium]